MHMIPLPLQAISRSHRFSVAPMMDRTDQPLNVPHRLLTSTVGISPVANIKQTRFGFLNRCAAGRESHRYAGWVLLGSQKYEIGDFVLRVT